MVIKQNTTSSPDRNRGARTVRGALPAVAEITTPRADRADGLVVNGQPVEVKWIGEGNLADVRSALGRQPGRNVVGRQMPHGTCAALSQAGVSWADETGAAEIAIGTILVSRSGVAQKLKRWTPAVLAVA